MVSRRISRTGHLGTPFRPKFGPPYGATKSLGLNCWRLIRPHTRGAKGAVLRTRSLIALT